MNHFANNGKEYLRKEPKKTHYKDFKWKMPGDITKYIGERDKKRDTSMILTRTHMVHHMMKIAKSVPT